MLTLTAALIILSVTSCNPTHEHAFSEWESVTAPTCTSFDLNKRDCECGTTEYATVSALSHVLVIDKATDATCTSSGETEGSHCGTCGVIITAQDTVPRTGHYFG